MTPRLGIYVHWPYCARICPYCDFTVVRDRGRAEEAAALGGAILADLEGQATVLGPRALGSIFFGGGTPSLMDPALVAAVIAAARRLFPVVAPLEVSLEANPSTAESGRFGALAAAGVTRLSLGVQSFADEDLRFLGRNHDVAAAHLALGSAQEAFGRVSLDLIYGLPGRTHAHLAAQLGRAAAAGVEHVSAYELTIEPGTAFHRAVARGRFASVDAGEGADLYGIKTRVLEDLGFDAYEVSNHARRPSARCAHNLVYWRGGEYLGVGPSAHGRRLTGEGWRATIAETALPAYIARVGDTGVGWAEDVLLTPRERAEERVMMGLRTEEGVDLVDLAPLPMDGLGALLEEGFLTRTAARLQATPKGRLVLNAIVAILAR